MDEQDDVKTPLLPPTLPRWWRVLPSLILIIIISTIDGLTLNDFIEYRYTQLYNLNSSSTPNTRELCLNSTQISPNASELISTTTSKYPVSTTMSWSEIIQMSTARLNVYINLAATIPSILTSILLGANCDRIGRKPLLALPFIGKTIRYMILTPVAYYDLSNIWIIISIMVDGLFGTAALNILSSFAYVTDCTDEKTRTVGIIIADVCIVCCRFIPLLTIGVYLQQPKFIQTMIFTLFLSVCGFIFSIVFQPESKLDVQHLNIFQQLKKVRFGVVTKIFRVFFVKRPEHKQRSLLMLVSTHLTLICMAIGNMAMYYIYLYGAPFCLDSFGVSLNSVAQTVTSIFFTVIFTLTIGKRSDHLLIPALGCLAYMTQLVLFGFARQVWMLYLAACIGGLFSVLTPIIRSRITKSVEPDEYAVVFILASVLESGGYYAISALANEIYRVSLTFCQGLVYFVFASVGSIAILLMLILYIWEYRPTVVKKVSSLNE
ncbi:unnamed protein product [Adineta steineri]|uniref:Proton-coupled folate transporter-like protein n=1 Tax=Adineta steineri TaxID=433720 RepID=A0A814FL64_9BILA|nr:unnamed protein product [Adineta steineri]CAF1007845.1 unnamed protein product [Adineta steineri]CAF3694988.1 unnamed protein product [Adineta steineri]CAF3897000.1 unnamed protein product [Adineta steineri]